jgi:endoglucanase
MLASTRSLVVLAFFVAILNCAGCRPVASNESNDPHPAIGTSATLRGAMIGPRVGQSDLRELASWGANHIRFSMNWDTFPKSPADSATREQYSAWLEGQLERLDNLIPVCEELGLSVVVDMHTPVCGRYQPGTESRPLIFRLFRDGNCQKQFVEDWEKIARRYRGKSIIWGYDLLNEPHEGAVPSGIMNWRQLAGETIEAIRAIDPNVRIIYEPALDTLGQEVAKNAAITPLSYENIAYSIHIYAPLEFTHQSVGGRPYPVYYPSGIDGIYWDINHLREYYKPLIDFQKKNQATIYIGEFSVIRWAPAEAAEQYLSDVITIIEENGWHAAYHAFREWNGWSVEYDSDYFHKEPVSYTTQRKRILLDWYAGNQ